MKCFQTFEKKKTKFAYCSENKNRKSTHMSLLQTMAKYQLYLSKDFFTGWDYVFAHIFNVKKNMNIFNKH